MLSRREFIKRSTLATGGVLLAMVQTWPILRRSQIHTHFALEHLADWQGFMEGAINTGEAAAGRI